MPLFGKITDNTDPATVEDVSYILQELDKVLSHAVSISRSAFMLEGESCNLVGFLLRRDGGAHLVFNNRSEQEGGEHKELVTTAVVASEDGYSTRVFPVITTTEIIRMKLVDWARYFDGQLQTACLQGNLITGLTRSDYASYYCLLSVGEFSNAQNIYYYLRELLGLPQESITDEIVDLMFLLASRLEITYGSPNMQSVEV